MKTLFKNTLIAVCLIIITDCIQAQATQQILNQPELIKQFIGNWQCEMKKDTFFFTENKSFGNGIIAHSQIVTKGENLDSIIQLIGYDRNADKFVMAELNKSSPAVEICSIWFTSENAGETVITNPGNTSMTYKFEFKSPDMLVQTAFLDNMIVKELLITRIKSEP
jgi:hypothetical protein